MRILLIIIIGIVLFSGCKPRTKHDNEIPENGVVKRKVTLRAYPGKELEVENEYRNKQLVRNQVYYPNGKTMNRYVLIDSAAWKWEMDAYYESGAMRSRSIASTDSFRKETDWYDNGQVQTDFTRRGGNKDSVVHYFRNGVKKEIAEFLDNKRNGRWQEWDSLGHQTRNEVYRNGKLQ